jgi:hypothetical protein
MSRWGQAISHLVNIHKWLIVALLLSRSISFLVFTKSSVNFSWDHVPIRVEIDKWNVHKLYFLWWDWGLNLGLCVCKADTLWAIPKVHFALAIFGDAGVSRTLCPGWLQTVILPILVSQGARIIGVSHWCPAPQTHSLSLPPSLNQTLLTPGKGQRSWIQLFRVKFFLTIDIGRRAWSLDLESVREMGTCHVFLPFHSKTS